LFRVLAQWAEMSGVVLSAAAPWGVDHGLKKVGPYALNDVCVFYFLASRSLCGFVGV